MSQPKQADMVKQALMMAIEETLEHIHGERMGATLFVFELGKDGGTNVAYISNAERAEMIDTIKQWLARVEVGITDDPAGPLGVS